jgi:hypothetical protein
VDGIDGKDGTSMSADEIQVKLSCNRKGPHTQRIKPEYILRFAEITNFHSQNTLA